MKEAQAACINNTPEQRPAITSIVYRGYSEIA